MRSPTLWENCGSGSCLKEDREVGEEPTEISSFPVRESVERLKVPSPGGPEERAGLKNGPGAHVETVRCILVADLAAEMVISGILGATRMIEWQS